MQYCVGFAFTPGLKSLALIRKNRPDWQAGKLNGIGGKVESGEDGRIAQVREFFEETGVKTELSDWSYLGDILGSNSIVHVFTAEHELFKSVGTKTDEIVRLVDPLFLPSDVLPNLRWLVPAAMNYLMAPPDLKFRITARYHI